MKKHGPIILFSVLCMTLLASVALANGAPNVNWQVLSGGGALAESSSGVVALKGTLGQTAIGWSAASHGGLGAGFWYGLGEGVYEIYLPVVLRNYG